MDLITLILGVLLGLVIGATISALWMNKLLKNKASSAKNTEAELKALLAEQAKNHVHRSRSGLEQIRREITHLLDDVDNYEKGLSVPSNDDTSNTFFGEHATVFLRNTELEKSKKEEIVNTDNQPKDFANSGSGVFAGSSISEQAEKIEKSNN